MAEEENYELRAILMYEQRGREDFYKVSWKGYSHEHDSWEPRRHILQPNDKTMQQMRTLKQRWLENKSKAKNVKREEENHEEKEESSVQEESAEPSEEEETGKIDGEKSDDIEVGKSDEEEESQEGDEGKAVRKTKVEEKGKRKSQQSETGKSSKRQKTEVPKVVSRIKRNEGQLVARFRDDKGTSDWVPVSSFRYSDPQSLMDYLLNNLQFLNSRGSIIDYPRKRSKSSAAMEPPP